MQPPLAYSPNGNTANTWGSATLQADEIQKIKLFADDLIGEYQVEGTNQYKQYALMPRDPNEQSADGTTVTRQYSCATFVVAAYQFARIHFLKSRTSDLPPASLATLKSAYPDCATLLDRPRFRSEFLNLKDGGPWPVLLPGYVLNALNRPSEMIRSQPAYQAVPGDEYFPSA